MPSGYTVNGTDFDDLFLPRVIGAATANSGYKVGTQDLSDRYEASRSVGDRSTTTTNLKISSGADINTLYMAKRTAVIPRKTSIDEGGSVTFDVAVVGFAAGTTLYWTLSRSDLSPNNGSFVVQSSGAHSFTVTANNDVTTEGTTSFTASIRRDSVSGTIVATSADVTINDTSLTPPRPNYSIGLRVDVYRDVGTAAGSFLTGRWAKKGGFVRVLISRSSVLQYGADGKCSVGVSFANGSFTNITNWNTTLSITQDQLLNSTTNTIKGIVPGGEVGYYDITGVLPVPSSAGWQETRNCIPTGSITTITLRDNFAGTTKSGSVTMHSNGLTGQAYPKYF